MSDIKRMPAFPTQALFTYLCRTSVEDYFCFLEQKIPGCTPEAYRIFRERMCSSLRVHKTESLKELMSALYDKICVVRGELGSLAEELCVYDDIEDPDSTEQGKLRDQVEKKAIERDDLYVYIYVLFIQPLLLGLGDAQAWSEQMKQRIGSCRLTEGGQ